jgi:hypothetical protein
VGAFAQGSGDSATPSLDLLSTDCLTDMLERTGVQKRLVLKPERGRVA